MTEEFFDPAAKYVPIPAEFHSLYGPFAKCIHCECELVESNVTYAIERIFRGEEPIVEFAICFPCQREIGKEMSQLSSQRIEAFLEERIVWEDRLDLMEQPGEEVSPWIDTCVITKAPKSECKEYEIVAICQGDRLALGAMPLMLSGPVIEEMQKLLSKKTRDSMGDFIDSHFGMPPEFCDLPRTPIFL